MAGGLAKRPIVSWSKKGWFNVIVLPFQLPALSFPCLGPSIDTRQLGVADLVD
jgi:hypothetical protein